MRLLISIVKASYHTKCAWLSNQKCMTKPTLINLSPNEYSQELQYYPLLVKLGRCVGSCNTFIDFYISHAFLNITIALLIIVSIYFYLIIY